MISSHSNLEVVASQGETLENRLTGEFFKALKHDRIDA